MGFLTKDAFKEVKKLSEPVCRTPKSVQQAIPICQVGEGGIFQLENKKNSCLFDKAYLLEDTNYATKDEKDRVELLLAWCRLLNAMGADFKVVTAILNRDVEEMLQRILPSEEENPRYRDLAAAYGQLIRKRLMEGICGNEKKIFLVVSLRRRDFETAKASFQTLEARLSTLLHHLGSRLLPLDGLARLTALHSVYRMGHENQFSYTWKELTKPGRDWRNDVCSNAVQEEPRYMQLGDQYAQVLFGRAYPNSLPDGFMAKLTGVPFHVLVSMDVAPIPQELTVKKLEAAQINNEFAIAREQDEKNKRRAYASDISYPKRRRKEELEFYLDQVHNNDQKLFYLGLLITVFGETKEELEGNAETIRSIASEQNLLLDTLSYRQRPGLHTCLPLGVREVDVMRTMFTSAMSAFLPFHVQDLLQIPGVYYGVNRISREVVLLDRKLFMNANGFVFGMTGSGKSMAVKMEIGQAVYLYPRDHFMILDPQNEYFDFVRGIGGQVLEFSKEQGLYLNPWELPGELPEDFNIEAFLLEKAAFTKTICKAALQPSALGPIHRAVIDRSVTEFYERLLTGRQLHQVLGDDTLIGLREIIGRQPEPEARELYTALEVFTDGSLNVFAKPGNVDLGNRILCFGLDNLGKELRRLAMLVVSEVIRSQIEYNSQKGIATWIYADEFQIITEEELGLELFDNLFRTVRKKGGSCTGLTQTLSDNLLSPQMQAMVSNAEFVIFMNQSGIDRDMLRRVYPEASEEELRYITNAEPGKGLLKCGKKIIPLDATIPKDHLLYRQYTTRFADRQEELRKKRANGNRTNGEERESIPAKKRNRVRKGAAHGDRKKERPGNPSGPADDCVRPSGDELAL